MILDQSKFNHFFSIKRLQSIFNQTTVLNFYQLPIENKKGRKIRNYKFNHNTNNTCRFVLHTLISYFVNRILRLPAFTLASLDVFSMHMTNKLGVPSKPMHLKMWDVPILAKSNHITLCHGYAQTSPGQYKIILSSITNSTFVSQSTLHYTTTFKPKIS